MTDLPFAGNAAARSELSSIVLSATQRSGSHCHAHTHPPLLASTTGRHSRRCTHAVSLSLLLLRVPLFLRSTARSSSCVVVWLGTHSAEDSADSDLRAIFDAALLTHPAVAHIDCNRITTAAAIKVLKRIRQSHHTTQHNTTQHDASRAAGRLRRRLTVSLPACVPALRGRVPLGCCHRAERLQLSDAALDERVVRRAAPHRLRCSLSHK